MASSSRITIHNVVPLIDNEVSENMVSCCAIHSKCKYIRGKMDYGAKIGCDLHMYIEVYVWSGGPENQNASVRRQGHSTV